MVVRTSDFLRAFEKLGQGAQFTSSRCCLGSIGKVKCPMILGEFVPFSRVFSR
jgi:hypothetical protein